MKKIFSDAIDELKKGNLVVYPTDTLYALGANIFDEKAIKKVFSVKNRPLDLPLPVAVADINQMKDICHFDKRAKSLVDFFLPGVLTLVVEKKNCVSDIVTSGSSKVAVRIPDNSKALELIESFGPLTVTSANIHGQETPGLIKDVLMQFKQSDISACINDGFLRYRPSTIVDITEDKPLLLRKGAISLDDIMDVI